MPCGLVVLIERVSREGRRVAGAASEIVTECARRMLGLTTEKSVVGYNSCMPALASAIDLAGVAHRWASWRPGAQLSSRMLLDAHVAQGGGASRAGVSSATPRSGDRSGSGHVLAGAWHGSCKAGDAAGG
ncbi:hypothetical protein Maq22A_c28245 [Methylobacterium aquaticum]|uniref:Uncharacterized protein n=1 Tax=Methylobacterium aquaticum TaxID=270351 RepID=A0A1Y0ZGQ2_9HYPH|nr:hypothetical protein Maq22A_c28245 [Methylobacterium aquaticum]